jgi:adenine-specific DNA methylase
MEKIKQEFAQILSDRIIECLSLSISDEALKTTTNVVARYANELQENVNRNSDNTEIIKKYFNNFVNKVLSSVEVIGLKESQYKAMRKLILSEIYSCLDLILEK